MQKLLLAAVLQGLVVRRLVWNPKGPWGSSWLPGKWSQGPKVSEAAAHPLAGKVRSHG